jgi:hypothetical protein
MALGINDVLLAASIFASVPFQNKNYTCRSFCVVLGLMLRQSSSVGIVEIVVERRQPYSHP